ncbi:hypothetical protein LWM68_16070 [Niabella sp. W65]|nr:hypothetical protein [Niabella sp. W65]MCH7364138.1 hypothetical protein [Niabella sp. W65]
MHAYSCYVCGLLLNKPGSNDNIGAMLAPTAQPVAGVRFASQLEPTVLPEASPETIPAVITEEEQLPRLPALYLKKPALPIPETRVLKTKNVLKQKNLLQLLSAIWKP